MSADRTRSDSAILDALGELCPCSYDPDGPGPLQECPVDGDGVTFAAEVRRLRRIEQAARAYVNGPDSDSDERYDDLVDLIRGTS